jgi:CO/xanthine dehydrogenase FAD-binding subunit
MPASATRSCPVIQPASSEARKATAGAMSLATPRRGLARAAETAAEAARAVEDANGSVEYKEHLVSVLVRRTFAEALARVAHL